MAVTIKDVAEKCGLSISTVSKAFNNYADISAETREAVQRAAREIAEGLARAEVTVVSGMARGIDTCAHEGAMAGQGRTVAVLGCGV